MSHCYEKYYIRANGVVQEKPWDDFFSALEEANRIGGIVVHPTNIPVRLEDKTDEEKETWGWEHYCGSCDNYETDECPNRGKVNIDTLWADYDGGICCDDFWD